MEKNEFKVDLEKLKGKTVEDIAINTKAVVIKFTDKTFLDVYLDSSGHTINTSSNKLED